MPRCIDNSLKSKENSNTILMMKLFQENVKKDISNTNDVLRIVQQKLKDCDLSLSSLKQYASELNLDFAKIETKVNDLDISFKSLSSTCSSASMSRNSSSSSFSENAVDNQEAYARNLVQGVTDELEDLEKTFIFVSNSSETECVEFVPTSKRASIDSSSVGSSSNSEESCSDEEDALLASANRMQDKVLSENCIELIQMLLKNSSTLPVDNNQR